ncbi:MAG: helix-turn-helix domain-containing protein [bacterium]|nr:helix-turn-helix domain-containing protein [bacterium]
MSNLPIENKKVLKIKDLLKYFCGYGLSSIPVINKSKKLIGILKKENLIATSSSVVNLEKPLKEFTTKNITSINFLEDSKALSNLVLNCEHIREIPVINEEGILIDFWTPQEIFLSLNNNISFSVNSWRKIFDNFPCISIFVDHLGKIILANKLAKKYLFEGIEVQDKEISKICPDLAKYSTKYEKLEGKRKNIPNLKESLVTIKDKKYYCKYNLILDEKRVLGKVFLLREPSVENISQNLNENNLKKTISPLEEAILGTEKDIISRALSKTKGNISACANLLKIPRQTLQYKIKKLNLKSIK